MQSLAYARRHWRILHKSSREQPTIRWSKDTIAHVLIEIHLNQAQGSNISSSSKAGSCATNATMNGRQEASNLLSKQEQANTLNEKVYLHIPSTN